MEVQRKSIKDKINEKTTHEIVQRENKEKVEEVLKTNRNKGYGSDGKPRTMRGPGTTETHT